MEHKLYFAHRGANKLLPENTIEAFATAVMFGANAIETDVHISRDGIPILSHEPDGLKNANTIKRIRDCSLLELRTWDLGREHGVTFRMPTLQDALEEFKNIVFNVDVKEDSVSSAQSVIDVIEKSHSSKRVIITSFHSNVMKYVRKNYKGPSSLSLADVRTLYVEHLIRFPKAPRVEFVQVPVEYSSFRLDTRKFIEFCHKKGYKIHYWVINNLEEAEFLLINGADGIMTDDVKIIRKLRKWQN